MMLRKPVSAFAATVTVAVTVVESMRLIFDTVTPELPVTVTGK